MWEWALLLVEGKMFLHLFCFTVLSDVSSRSPTSVLTRTGSYSQGRNVWISLVGNICDDVRTKLNNTHEKLPSTFLVKSVKYDCVWHLQSNVMSSKCLLSQEVQIKDTVSCIMGNVGTYKKLKEHFSLVCFNFDVFVFLALELNETVN